MSKKTYVLDTNVLLSDPESITSFHEHDVIVPMAVLEELDRHKSRSDEVGQHARHVSRSLDSLRQAGNLSTGVALPGGGQLRVASIGVEQLNALPVELRDSKVDNLIIAFMLQTAKSICSTENVILVSRDINVRIKCDSLGIACEDYRRLRASVGAETLYRGVEVARVDYELVEAFHVTGSIPASSINQRLYPNQIVVLKHDADEGESLSTTIVKCSRDGQCLVPVVRLENVFGLEPRNKEQKFSLDLLFDQNIKLLTLVGPSGTGKTLLALAAALEQLRGVGHPKFACYDKLVVTRPVQTVGKDIGFLPGTLEEKMQPWVAPIRDNINFLAGSSSSRRKRRAQNADVSDDSYLQLMQEHGRIEIEAIAFIRGRSIPNSFILIDEAQNLSMHELKTIITRAGEGTKIVLTGDIEQIDNVHVDAFTNGLTYAVERFKEQPIAGHVTLLKGERSELATVASKIL